MVKCVVRSSVVGIVAAAVLISGGVSAQAVSTEQLAACAQVENPLQRLVCYDKLAAGQGVTAATDATAPPTAKPESQFGKEHLAEDNAQADMIYVVVVNAREDAYGKWVLELDNGQKWRQTDSQTFRIQENEEYYIERGLLNSFYLGREGQNRRIQVRRVD
ncbi:hypothetical protein [Pseudidiomarina taiwanensis]|uniref:Lipoprotein n=1 Tax=Pseudidiomarina taiwanensis TaxID=337250 RepID=A0A432ZFU4_9GAMM|nr:hypothetical protein [Pseudidiomarina taiwanensis]RUO76779.1 hypothetical protein CWI83_07600 [Pseudidiomarina taiwanensis]